MVSSRTPVASAQSGQVSSAPERPAAPAPSTPQPAPSAQAAVQQQRPQPQAQTAPPPRQATSGYSNPMGTSVPPTSSSTQRGTQGAAGSLPSRAVPVTDEPDDEVDVPPFMRR